MTPKGPVLDSRHAGRTSGHLRPMGRARLFVKDVEPAVLTQTYARTLAAQIVAEGNIEKRKHPLLIGLTGPSGVGKTEIVKHLLDKHGFTSTHVGWPVKKGLRDGFNLSTKDVDGGNKNTSVPELGGVEPKLVLDHMGEALARTAPLATALHLGKTVDHLRKKGHKMIVVDGVRQQAEADFIHRRGGIMVRVDDGSGPDPQYPMDKRAWKIPVDHHIDTSGSLDKSKGEIDKLMAGLRLSHPAFIRKDIGAGDVHVATDLNNATPRRKRKPLFLLGRDPNAEPKPL